MEGLPDVPALPNPKHERFVQELAKGKTADEAYKSAGYSANRHNAAALARKEHISTRLAEIQERAATRVEITVADITKRLLKIATKGEKSNDAPMLSVARASLMDAAKLNGLIVDTSKVEAEVKAVHRVERVIVRPPNTDR